MELVKVDEEGKGKFNFFRSPTRWRATQKNGILQRDLGKGCLILLNEESRAKNKEVGISLVFVSNAR